MGNCFNNSLRSFFKSDDDSEITMRKTEKETAPSSKNTGLELIQSFDFDNLLYVKAASGSTCLFGDSDYSLILFDYENKSQKKKWKGHSHDITKILFSNKTNNYISSSRDKSIKLWNSNSDSSLITLLGHELVVTAIASNQNNNLLMSGSRDNNIILWDLQSGKLLNTSHISRNLVTDMYWSSDDIIVVQSSEDKELRLWDPKSLKVIHSFPKKQYIQSSCHISYDNNYALSTSNGFQGNGCEITVWDLRKNTIIHELFGHQQTVSSAKFLQNGKVIASCSHDSTVKLWDLNTLKTVDNVYVGGTLTNICESENRSLIVSSLTSGLHIIKNYY